jgi:hypothetical protein
VSDGNLVFFTQDAEEQLFAVRANAECTKKCLLSGAVVRNSFYEDLLVMKGNESLLDWWGHTLIKLFKNNIPSNLLDTLEATAAKYAPLVEQDCSVDDIRGPHVSVRLGFYLERGGSGGVTASRYNYILRGFLRENRKLWKHVAMVFHAFAPDVAETVCCIPQKYRPFDCFSLGFWNLTNVSVVQRQKGLLLLCGNSIR